MARFYADENFPLPVVVKLRELEHDVLTAREDGKANQKIPDEEVLKTATEKRRALLTMNRRDFALLHRNQPQHAGIVLCKYESNFAGQATRIEAATRDKELSGQLFRVERESNLKN